MTSLEERVEIGSAGFELGQTRPMPWGWCIGAIIGIAIAFGTPPIVTWVRSTFGV